MMASTTEASTSPVRVPIINPSSGVRPIEVSMHLPPSTAETDAPLPMWQVTIFCVSGFTPSNLHTRSVTKRWLVPCAPQRRMLFFS